MKRLAKKEKSSASGREEKNDAKTAYSLATVDRSLSSRHLTKHANFFQRNDSYTHILLHSDQYSASNLAIHYLYQLAQNFSVDRLDGFGWRHKIFFRLGSNADDKILELTIFERKIQILLLRLCSKN
uniref:Uncharacterized protein n=1 Tax=Romanomermis culicivorax TaxID=13658 RepID=A0A915K558_ROMCU